MDNIGAKYSTLHQLYAKLYGLAILDKENVNKWTLYEDPEEGSNEAEFKGTEGLDLEERLKIHSLLYDELSKKYEYYNIGENGLCKLF